MSKQITDTRTAEKLALSLHRFMQQFMPAAQSMIRTGDLTAAHRDSFLTTLRHHQSDMIELIDKLTNAKL